MTLAFHTSVTSKTVLDVIFFKLKLVLIDAIAVFFPGGEWFLLNEVFRGFGMEFWSALESILELRAGSFAF